MSLPARSDNAAAPHESEELATALHMPLRELRRIAADAGIKALLRHFRDEGETLFPIVFSVKAPNYPAVSAPSSNIVPFRHFD